MSLFKANYGYNSVILFTPKQIKKSNKVAKERIKKLITLHKKLCKSTEIIKKKWSCIITGKNLRDQTLKREIKYGCYTKTLKADN